MPCKDGVRIVYDRAAWFQIQNGDCVIRVYATAFLWTYRTRSNDTPPPAA